MLINSSSLQALRTSLNLAYSKAYEATETFSEKLATKIPVSNDSGTYGWIAQQIKLRQWDGPRVALALSEHEYTLRNLPFEATIKIPRDHILDDSLGIYTAAILPGLGEAVRKHPDTLLIERLLANPTAFDGESLFSDSHPVYNDDGDTYDNNFALALSNDNVDTARTNMASYIGENDFPLAINPRLLIVPPALERTALEIAQSQTIVRAVENAAGTENVGGSTIDNVMRGRYDVLMIPELAGNDTTWYLADVSKAIKPFILQVRSEAILRSFDTGTERESFDNNEFTWGVDGSDGGSYRLNVGISLPFLISKSVPA